MKHEECDSILCSWLNGKNLLEVENVSAKLRAKWRSRVFSSSVLGVATIEYSLVTVVPVPCD